MASVHRNFRLWRAIAWLFAAAILLAPLVAMQFTAAVNWDAGDFLAMGILLAALLAALEIIHRAVRRPAGVLIVSGLAVLIFVLVWAELAVGLFD